MGISVEEYKALQANPRSRERNIRTEQGGRMRGSKKEARKAAEYDLLKKAGEIVSAIPEVSIPLPGGVRCRPDFMVVLEVYDDGTFLAKIEDVKGIIKKTGKPRISQDAKNKYKQVKSEYGITVQIVG